jgi:exopolysaccharide biosynthesis polyprenyl glycosylphosphotransferase
MQEIERAVGFQEGPETHRRERPRARLNDVLHLQRHDLSVQAVQPLTDRRASSISDAQHTSVLISVDFLAACAALPIALILLAGLSTVPANSLNLFRWNLAHDAIFPVGVVAALALTGSYRATRRAVGASTFKELQDLLVALGGGCVLTIALGIFLHATTKMEEPRATQLICAVIVAVVLITIGRSVVRHMLRSLTVNRILVVGSGALVDRIDTYLGLDKGATLVGRVVDSHAPEEGALGTVQDLPRLCEELSIQRIIVAYPDRMAEESIATYRQLQDRVHIALVPRYFELVSWRSHLTDLSGLPLIQVARPDLSRWDRFLKRAFDITVSLVSLIVLSPVWIAIVCAVRLTSPGPALFKQIRLGRYQRPFTIFKFRTMQSADGRAVTGSSNGNGNGNPNGNRSGNSTNGMAAETALLHAPLFDLRHKLDDSDRITRVGGFLRKTGLDEVPQLLNVLRGDMSIVGPRPFVPDESELQGWAARRFEVRPGITGLWQVSGRNQLSLEDLQQLDYLYVASWSFWWDLKIVFDTPRTMAHGIGAY